jgi:hypothetical protein
MSTIYFSLLIRFGSSSSAVLSLLGSFSDSYFGVGLVSIVPVLSVSFLLILEFFSLDCFSLLSLLFLGVDVGNTGLLSIFSRALA